MKTLLIKILLLLIIVAGCDHVKTSSSGNQKKTADKDDGQNLLNAEELYGLEWMNRPESFEQSGSQLVITAPKESDFFVNPEDGKITVSAPLLYKTQEGDFVATACVKPDFSAMWNAAALMIYKDSTHWIKLAFENSDATGASVVSVVTNGLSDDANGVVMNQSDSLWLRMIRKGNIYALHWSENGKDFKMARISALPTEGPVKVGIEAQCPVGNPAAHTFLYFSIEPKTVENLRKGI